jgi:hypothetical protein
MESLEGWRALGRCVNLCISRVSTREVTDISIITFSMMIQEDTVVWISLETVRDKAQAKDRKATAYTWGGLWDHMTRGQHGSPLLPNNHMY